MSVKQRDPDDLAAEIEIYNTLYKRLKRLHRLVKSGEYRSDEGICGYVCRYKKYPNMHVYMSDLYPRWPNWSGSYMYPVPCRKGDRSRLRSKHAYDEYDHEHMWYTGEYAELRVELLGFLIKRTRSILRRRIRLLTSMGFLTC